jgi:hypothetical protein
MKLEMFNKNGRKRKIALVIPIIVLFFRHNNPCKPNGFDLKQFMKDLIFFSVKKYLPM